MSRIIGTHVSRDHNLPPRTQLVRREFGARPFWLLAQRIQPVTRVFDLCLCQSLTRYLPIIGSPAGPIFFRGLLIDFNSVDNRRLRRGNRREAHHDLSAVIGGRIESLDQRLVLTTRVAKTSNALSTFAPFTVTSNLRAPDFASEFRQSAGAANRPTPRPDRPKRKRSSPPSSLPSASSGKPLAALDS